MFAGIGVNWSGTLLGCVAALLVPIPVVFYKYGHKIRQRSKFAPTFEKANEANDYEATSEDADEAVTTSVKREESAV